MKRMMILSMLLLSACAPAAQSPVLPQFVATDTPYISPSYPTEQARVESPLQSAAGFDVRVDKAWVDGKNVNANVCFTLPDQSDWSIYSASLKYGEIVNQEYGTTLLSLTDAANGQAGQRCDTLTFVVPPDADLTTATIQIDSIGATPRQDDYCDVYMPKIQESLMARGIGIVLGCDNVNGAQQMQIKTVPPEMTQAQAEALVYSDEFFTVKGPWSFALNLSH